MQVKPGADIRSSDITPRDLYLGRRDFLASAGKAAVAAFAGTAGFSKDAESAVPGDKLAVTKRVVTTSDTLTPQQAVTSDRNYYEFGSVKSDPARNAGTFKPKPWSVTVDGLCGKPDDVHHGGRAEAARHRGTGLSDAVRRGMVDGDPVGRVFAARLPRAIPAAIHRQVRGVRLRPLACRRWPASGSDSRKSCPGLIGKDCGWTKPCTR